MAQQDEPPKPARMPDGRLQTEVMLEAEHKRSLAEAQVLVELALAVKAELERDTRHVLSLSQLKRLDEIERVAKRLRGRLKK